MKYRGKHRQRRVFTGLRLSYTTVAVLVILASRFILI
jgi:hypothetical protein